METSSITPHADGSCTLAIAGAFPPQWTGALCAGLSARRISVERGFARQVRRGAWEASFVLRALEPGLELAQIDYRRMALATGVQAGAKPRIDAFDIVPGRESLAVTIRAPDALGLLGQLLGAFSLVMLFVHDMQIQTVGGEARDAFVLKGLGGVPPTREQRLRLTAALQAMVAADLAATGS